MDANGKILEIVPAQGVRQVSPPIVHIRIDCGMSVFVDRTLFQRSCWDPKSKGAAGRSARNVCRYKSGSAAINSFLLKSERRFHWNYGGGGGGW